jgi:hypothetical protein
MLPGLTTLRGAGLDLYRCYPGVRKPLMQFILLRWRRFESSRVTAWAMCVEGEEPLTLDLKGLESDVREPFCREYAVSVDTSCQVGPGGQGQSP